MAHIFVRKGRFAVLFSVCVCRYLTNNELSLFIGLLKVLCRLLACDGWALSYFHSLDGGGGRGSVGAAVYKLSSLSTALEASRNGCSLSNPNPSAVGFHSSARPANMNDRIFWHHCFQCLWPCHDQSCELLLPRQCLPTIIMLTGWQAFSSSYSNGRFLNPLLSSSYSNGRFLYPLPS